MAILKLTDVTTRHALRHPLIRDRVRIGRGAFCIVFNNENSVFKLTCDPFQYQFYTHRDRPQSEYFPTLIYDFGVVGGTEQAPLYLVEMEKLCAFGGKQTSPPGAWQQRQNLLKVAHSHRQKVWMKFDGADAESQILIACLRGLGEYEEIDDGLQVAASRLADFCQRVSCSPDLHRSNFMLRGSQLVFNDAVKDQHTIYRRNLLRLMPPEAADAYMETRMRTIGLATAQHPFTKGG